MNLSLAHIVQEVISITSNLYNLIAKCFVILFSKSIIYFILFIF